MKLTLPALRSRNYRLFFAGQGISLIGTWMTQLATVWVAYQLTESAFVLGLVGFMGQVPNFFLAPFGGLLADRFDRRSLLIATQAFSMVQSLLLAGFTLSGTINLWLLLGLGFLQGLITVVDAPTRQTFVKDMIERREDLASAIALNSTMVNGGRLLGPAIAGIVIARVGAGYCFLIDGLSYIAVIAGLLLMQIRAQPRSMNQSRPLQSIREGFNYAFRSTSIRSILTLMAIFSLMVMSNTILAPVMALQVLRVDAHTLGFLLAASGIGALIGGGYMSTRSTVVGLNQVIAIAPILAGIGLICFGLSTQVWLSIPAMMLTGFGTILQISASNTVLQTIVEDDKRGRIMSLFTMSFLGIAPFGQLLAGTLATAIGASSTLMLNGTVCILAALLFAKQLFKLDLSSEAAGIRLKQS
ncbi:MFS transporter [Leptolyngbya sp. AN03gr2]|uniref:MFS transporter n=1 Tax=unclassified Leptolyngbya TaxID=2650499 RepID=UPI003D322196